MSVNYARLTTTLVFSFDADAGEWLLRDACNEGYDQEPVRHVTIKDMVKIAKSLDYVFFGPDAKSTWKGRTYYTDLIEDVHAAARNKLADDVRVLDGQIARREAKIKAMSALDNAAVKEHTGTHDAGCKGAYWYP